jgi:hypothetical protein
MRQTLTNKRQRYVKHRATGISQLEAVQAADSRLPMAEGLKMAARGKVALRRRRYAKAGASQQAASVAAGYSPTHGARIEQDPEVRAAIIAEADRILSAGMARVEGQVRGEVPTRIDERRGAKGKVLETLRRYDSLDAFVQVARVRGILQGKDLAEPHAGPEVRRAVLDLMRNDPQGHARLSALAKEAEDILYGPGDPRGRAVVANSPPVPRLPPSPPEPSDAQD